MKKIIMIGIIYGISIYIAFLYRDPLLNWLNQSDLSQLPFMFFLSIFFGVIPIVPFTVFAGVMGAKYGVWVGAIINWTGSVGAAAVFFVLARYFFVSQFQNYIVRFKKIKKFELIISKNAFIAILFSRMIPIIPPPAVNVYSGLSSMLFKTYILATALGQIPGMLVYAYLGNQLFVSPRSFAAGILFYLGFIIIILFIYRWWYKKKS
ncbi:VTT domain-containing protein [Virgibacillus sp. C22-A2]|uniref:TVP38/TMEM64 family membrane protein n=1 Tax=Virgibacillus tibetensis TaxID=3042313 RepID=A0ABU6KDZ7_9BACI|nr:VTT domain-containing protein [Virgibacillus sp. C22-A2]